ncbi:MAG: hypothetical protein IJ597_00585, partial [Synergistaceae bacterium]|nr:hypothetical protein [Synergistaceae bacterium]
MSLCEVYIPPEECAKCRFCCSYRRCSLWETALIDEELLEKLKKRYPDAKFKFVNGYYTVDLDGLYKTDDPEEEALCYFNNGKGCILGEDKPFECRVWPLRVLKKDRDLVIAFSDGCPVFARKSMSEIRELLSGGLGKKLLDYAKKFPAFIKEYKNN